MTTLFESHNLGPGGTFTEDLRLLLLKLEALEDFHSTAHNELISFVFQRWLCQILTSCSFMATFSSNNKNGNKTNYSNFANVFVLLNRCRIDFVNHHLNQAALLFTIGRYKDSFSLLDRTKEKLDRPSVMFTWDMEVKRYMAAGGEYLPIETIAKHAICGPMILDGRFELSEVYMETHKSSGFFKVLCIPLESPPMVFCLFLRHLCARKHRWMTEKNQALKELSYLVNNDNGYHIPHHLLSVSWQLLGICQQMEGDFRAACHSFLMALRQEFNPFRKTTCIRLCTILVEYFQ